MFAKILRRISLVSSVLALNLLAGCGNVEKPPQNPETLHPAVQPIYKAAAQKQIPVEPLLLIAWTQKKLDSQPTTQPQLTESFQLLANDLAEKRNAQAPSQAWDWLYLAAQSITGYSKNYTLSQMQTTLVMHELLYAFNTGFTMLFPDFQTLHFNKASTPLNKNTLNKNQRILLETPTQELWGNPETLTTQKYASMLPRVVLRFCPYSVFQCFEHLRQTTQTPAHLMLYRDYEGDIQSVTFFSLNDDLPWYENLLHNTVVITLAGFLGEAFPSLWRADAFTWKDYVGVSQIVYKVFQSFIKVYKYPKVDSYASLIVHQDKDHADELSIPPFAQHHFAMPPTWDRKLFLQLVDFMSKNYDNLNENACAIENNTTLRKKTDPFIDAHITTSLKEGKIVVEYMLSTNPAKTYILKQSAITPKQQQLHIREYVADFGAKRPYVLWLKATTFDLAETPRGMAIQGTIVE